MARSVPIHFSTLSAARSSFLQYFRLQSKYPRGGGSNGRVWNTNSCKSQGNKRSDLNLRFFFLLSSFIHSFEDVFRKNSGCERYSFIAGVARFHFAKLILPKTEQRFETLSSTTDRKSTSGTEWAVEAIGLTKDYGRKRALNHLDLKIRSNQILVILGPNGSGKTTFLHLISTVLKPSDGTALVMGYDIRKEALKVRQVSAISFQDPRGFWRHKPAQILSFHASMYGVGGDERKKVVEETLKEFELWDSRNTKFMHLSGGQAKRLEVAKLFVH